MKNSANNCILCGSHRRNLLYSRQQWNVYQCTDCKLGVLDPRPDDDELTKLYEQEYFQDQYKEELRMNSPAMQERLAQEKHRLRFFRPYKKEGSVLDIGCGRAYFLLACRKKGYNVEGIDVSADVAAYVSRELKIPVHIGEAGNIELPEKTFDVVTMWHSLEHTVDPNIYLQKARHWLKDDGVLVVDVPNYAGHDALKTWENWRGWQLPYHFYHFTKSSLYALLNKNGFTVIRKKHYLSEYIKEKLEKFFLPSFISRIIARFYSGHSFAVVARKSKNR
ncbi:MAG: putative S-adenosylmethionine-dependent methyltransferase [Smithella sp. PtaU1.Bin162]|nr:MAG: putative S-adenosylmethionine-dependent methyltransferase [Smithella sp. PtaU1.Bin162]